MAEVKPLRDYQKRASDACVAAVRGEQSLLTVAPTGSGKTRIVIDVCKRARGRTLVMVPWRFLVGQTERFFQEIGVPCGVLHGDERPADGCPTWITTTATAARRDLPRFEAVIVDEAHGAVAPQCRSVLRGQKDATVLGFTATAVRLDRKPLGVVFKRLHEPVTVAELIERNLLVPSRTYGPPEGVDLAHVPLDGRTGDYRRKQAAEHMGQPKLLGDAVEHWRRYAGKGAPTWAYACHLAHAAQVREAFERGGAEAELMDGSTAEGIRRDQLERMEASELDVLVNVGVLTEGVDFPPLRCIVLLRPTLSLGLHLQICGRGLRPAPGKGYCTYLDHAGNFRRHGFPEDPREWKLRRNERRRPRSEIESAVKAVRCPACGQLVPPGSNPCPRCGLERVPEVVPGKLQRLHAERRWLVGL